MISNLQLIHAVTAEAAGESMSLFTTNTGVRQKLSVVRTNLDKGITNVGATGGDRKSASNAVLIQLSGQRGR